MAGVYSSRQVTVGHGQSQQVEEGLGRFQWVLGGPNRFFQALESICWYWRVSTRLSGSSVGLGRSWRLSVGLCSPRWVLAGFVRSRWVLAGLKSPCASASLGGSQKVWLGFSGLGMLG